MSNLNRVNILSRCSFRQLLLVAFLLISGLLVATSVRALFTLESLAAHSRLASRQAVNMTEHLQRLNERTVAMERAARQFLVLDDPIFKERYHEAADQAQQALSAAASAMTGEAAVEIVASWNENQAALWQILQQPASRRGNAAADIQRILTQLPALNKQMDAEGEAKIGTRNDVMLEELEQQRAMLGWQVIGAIVLAVLLACVFGLWLSMPLAQLETVINRLGGGRFDMPVTIRGPSDLRRLGQQLDWLRQRLAKAEAEKIRFVHNVSRRLRAPSLDSAPELDAAARGSAELKHLALKQRISDVLGYHEAVLDAQQVNRLPVDLRGLLNKVIDDYRDQSLAKDIRVEIDGAVKTHNLDLTKMECVLSSLLSNAVRFSPPGGVVRFILTQMEPRGLRLDCIDQGPGVAPEDAPYIFDPFHATQEAVSQDRSGAQSSLAIAREYIEAQHGNIELLRSEEGAHFRITLPDEH
ncbi:MAG: histidine kinase [Herminiimonas sp.]|jgi:two-component system sensor histidine kinase GlrK|nr:histidine kinase [Herminiimonas sp.]